MDQLLQQILRDLTMSNPLAADRLRTILGGNLSALALLRALYQLMMEGLINREILLGLLRQFVRAGVLDAELVSIAIAESEADLAAARIVPKPPWWRLALRGGIWAILIYLLGAAVYDNFVDLEDEPAGEGTCAVAATPVPIVADESAVGPKSSLRDAKAEIKRLCNASAVVCTDPSCPTCGNDAFIQSVEVKTRIFWYTTVIKADCRCWCK